MSEEKQEYVYKIKPVMPNETDPFDSDKLVRRRMGMDICSLIKKVRGTITICIDGGWGSGKTTFLKMCKKQLEIDGLETVYYSAWEDDMFSDPLLSLFGQIWSQIKSADLKEMVGETRVAAKNVIRKAGFGTVTGFIKLVHRIASGGYGEIDLQMSDFRSIGTNIASDYNLEKQELDDLVKRIHDIAKRATENTGGPLVVFIDELDRCRPDFAIEILEIVKHLFELYHDPDSTPSSGLVFVFGVNKKQLCHSIKIPYGDGFDAEDYLNRFIDFSYSLPEPMDISFVEYLLEKYTACGTNLINYSTHLFSIFSHYSISLRQQEQIVRQIICIISKENKPDYTLIVGLAFLLTLKTKESNVYSMIIQNNPLQPITNQYILGDGRQKNKDSYFSKDNTGIVISCFMNFSHTVSRTPNGMDTIETALTKKGGISVVQLHGGDWTTEQTRLIEDTYSRLHKYKNTHRKLVRMIEYH